MNTENPFGHGALESAKDYRDIQLADVATAIPIPQSYFLNISQCPVTMQYKRGTCVAHATAKRKEKVEVDDTGTFTALSPRFLYALIKKEDGNMNEGTAIRNGLKIISKTGICTEQTYPSDYPDMTHAEFMDITKVPVQAFYEAELYKDTSYASVPVDKDSLKQAIMSGNGVITRVVIDSAWWCPTWLESDILPLKAPLTQAFGGHAIWITGFDGDRFYFRNSWGTSWGKNGDGYFDWNTYKDAITEAWTSIDIPDHLLKQVHELPVHQPLTSNLFFGCNNADVKRLQHVLGVLPESGFFGLKTLAAMIKYQRDNNISPAVGYCGEKSRLSINNRYFN